MLNNFLSAGRWSASATDWASLILRITLGGMMLLHGWDKLQSVMSGNIQFGDPIGLGVNTSMYLTVFAEFFCSILVLVGLWMRPALIPLIITMLVAVLVVHGADPLGEKEGALMYLLPYVALFLLGAGKYSLDFMMRKDK
jgi:putative oxidoreductase